MKAEESPTRADGPRSLDGQRSVRLASLDAFRGLDILVMIFVNYIAAMSAIPAILLHARGEADTYTLTDVVFPGFLFIVGVAIPLSLGSRVRSGAPLLKVLGRVAVRVAGLVFLGVLMVNEQRFSAADTGLSRAAWYLIAFLAVIGLWNIYPRTEDRSRRRLHLALRLASASALVVLVVLFRGRTESGALVWLQTSWWGILGLIGWAYLAGSLAYLVLGRSRAGLLGILGLLIALNVGSHLGWLSFLDPVMGASQRAMMSCHSAIVLAGVLVGTFFGSASGPLRPRNLAAFVLPFGLGLYAAGLILRPIQGISKIRATESYALVTAGVCALAFLGVYFLMDVLRVRRWAEFLRPVGRNPLLAYILPEILASALVLLSGLLGFDLGRVLWPFAERGGWPGMLNALAVTGLILLLTALATRWKVILRV
jgi:heparan-alpha-glucosaminide N-acetyltransferase